MRILDDSYAPHDLIGHQQIKDSLVEMIRSRQIHAESSFTIGVFGTWGSGKTSMLKQIQHDILNDEGIATVWFNPWQYSSNEDIIRAFFEILNTQLKEYESKDNIDVRTGNDVKKFIGLLSEASLALVERAQFKVGFPFASLSVGGLSEADLKRKSSENEHLQKSLEKYSSIYFDLANYCHNNPIDNKTKIVVLIDDLDRCMPDMSIRLLEGIKVLLDIPSFVFVLGVANKVIQRAVAIKYRDLYETSKSSSSEENEQSYLDKIIQFSVTLPLPDRDMLRQNILKEHLSEEPETTEISDLILSAVGDNPRSLKRFLNFSLFSRYMTSKSMKQQETYNEIVSIKSDLIAYKCPDIFKIFRSQPKLLLDLEKRVTEISEDKSPDPKELVKTGDPRIDNEMDNLLAVRLIEILKCGYPKHSFSRQSVGTETYLTGSASGFSEVIRNEKKVSAPVGSQIDRLQERLVCIAPGSFFFGSEKIGGRQVSITKPFLVDRFLVTQDLFSEIIGKKSVAIYRSEIAN